MIVHFPGIGVRPPRFRPVFFARFHWQWLVVATVLGIVAVATTFRLLAHAPSGPMGTLVASSTAPGAQVEIDGTQRGETPFTVRIAPGEHHIRLVDTRYLPISDDIRIRRDQTTTIHLDLWRRAPVVRELHPSFPGATIASAYFLRDGRIAVVEALPPGDVNELWVTDASGVMRPVGPRQGTGPLALDPTDQQIAQLASSHPPAPGGARLDEVLVTGSGDASVNRRYRIPLGSDEEISGLSWAPDADHLLVMSQTVAPGDAVRSRFFWIDLARETTRELVSIPSRIVPDSFAWSPEGRRVAFLTRTGSLTSLCVLDTAVTDGFTYLTDLGQNDGDPLPFAPIAWSADGQRLLYAAPVSTSTGPTGWLFGAKPVDALFLASITRPIGKRLGSATGQAPVWRDDGTILALARDRNGSLRVQEISADGTASDVGTIPLHVGGAFAVRWDVRHAQCLVVARQDGLGQASTRTLWLVQFGPGATL